MERDALGAMVSWCGAPNRKPLLLRGARQVGKTWLIKKFASLKFAKMAYISLAENRTARNVFEAASSVGDLVLGLSGACGVEISPANTLLVLDEIQESDRALNALKTFHEQLPSLAVVAAGSLLGVAVKAKGISFPVGQVDFLDIYPLTFVEFLDALGEKPMADIVRAGNTGLAVALKEKFVTLLRQYLFVGGMPEAVASFAESRSAEEVRRLQDQILTGYQSDFAKYTGGYPVTRIDAVWRSLPAQLARENRKFAYHLIEKSARAREYEAAVDWLSLCGLVYKVPRISKPALPLAAYMEAPFFKLYSLDSGLLGALAGLDFKTAVDGNRLFQEFKGAFTEQLVLQGLVRSGGYRIGYWATKSGTAEVDFVVQAGNRIIPIEVKATLNLKARSLASFRKQFAPRQSVRFSLADYEENNGLYNIPLYLLEATGQLVAEPSSVARE